MDSRKQFESQIFWIGEGELSNWYSFVSRTPFIPGHIIMCYKKRFENEDITRAPKGYEKALNLNINFLKSWSKKQGKELFWPVFFRTNIKGKEFRVHILPVSNKEIDESSKLLQKRIPELRGNKGGFIHYLGKREHEADKFGVEYKNASPERTKELMRSSGVIKVIKQLREIVFAQGFKSKLYN